MQMKTKPYNILKWPYIPDHLYRILIIGGSVSAKNKCIIEFNKQPARYWQNILSAKDPSEAKYQFLINKWESTGLKHLNDPKGFIEYSNDMLDVYKNIEKDYIAKNEKD